MKERRMILGLLLLVSIVPYMGAEIDTERTLPQQDLGDLYQRASASRFVVIGRAVKSDGVARRSSPAEKQKMIQVQPDGKE
jgi:hypothetical protein